MKNKRILYVSSELTPYLPSTHMSETSLELPRLMQEQGCDVRIFMPRFGCINERRHQLHEVIRLSGMNLVVNDIDQPLIIKVASVPKERLQVYFIDNEEYFKNRHCEYDEDGQMYPNNDERAIFFAKGVLETAKKLNWSPDIVHVNGWMSYMVPVFLKTLYKTDPAFADTKVVTSVFGTPYSGTLDTGMAKKLVFDGIDEPLLNEPTFENLTKTCLKYSDACVVEDAELNKFAVDIAKSRKLPCFNHPSGSTTDKDLYADLYKQILD
ncbi:MAG: glycogen/starch synthase [Flavobacteriales bacterium]|nr:glycogen/starch synthase [Flavobacteriales bacterium]